MINHILPIFKFVVISVRLWLCGALMLESPVATRKTSVNPSSSTILIGLQLFAIHLATVLVNLSQAVLVRALRCSVRVAHSTWTPLADQRMLRVEVVATLGWYCFGETITSSRRVCILLWFYWMFHLCFLEHELPIRSSGSSELSMLFVCLDSSCRLTALEQRQVQIGYITLNALNKNNELIL